MTLYIHVDDVSSCTYHLRPVKPPHARGGGGPPRGRRSGTEVASGRLDATVASRFSIDEGADIGMDRGSAVTQRTIGGKRFSAFNGVIEKVTLQIEPEGPIDTDSATDD